MTVSIIQRNTALKMAVQFFQEEYPDTIAIAYMELDCGCIKVCGVTADGKPLGSLNLALSQSANKKEKPPTCKACEKDAGISITRLRHHGIIWPSDTTRLPDKSQRLGIGQKLFGRQYTANQDTILDID
jgi:hypothetical protein